MNSSTLYKIHKEFIDLLGFGYRSLSAENQFENYSKEQLKDVDQFTRLFIESGKELHLTYLVTNLKKDTFSEFYQQCKFPFFAFLSFNEELCPSIIIPDDNKTLIKFYSGDNCIEKTIYNEEQILQLIKNTHQNGDNFPIITCIPHERFFEEENEEVKAKLKKLSPIQKLIRLINWEKKEIGYVYLYAIIAGIINLSLPLGIQSIIGFVQSGQITSSVIILISFIIVAIFLSGGLQILQLWIVEHIQQRLFTKTAFEFAYRLPVMSPSTLDKNYAPELMNRFFDIVTLQKSLSGILLDFSGAILQILFGLILLSLYHSSFIIFGLLLIGFLVVIFRYTGPRGLDTSLKESKYKYLSANWLQNVARTIQSFKGNGYVNLHLEKTDFFVTNYLFARKAHFKILLSQYWSFVIFKILITGGLLIIGCVLLVNKQINIGQFVASEIIIILILNAIEKAIIKMENVYDVLTSIEKINQVTDLPTENYKGLWLENTDLSQGVKINFKDFNLFDSEKNTIISNLNLSLDNRETLVLRHPNRYVVYRLIDVITRSNKQYNGSVSINDVPVKNINKNSIHEIISIALPDDGLFDGSIIENISMGKPYQLNTLLDILKKLGALDEINALPDGIETALIGGNNTMVNPLVKKIILSRHLLNEPHSLFIDDYFLDEIEPEKTIRTIREIIPNACIIIISNHSGLSSSYKTHILT